MIILGTLEQDDFSSVSDRAASFISPDHRYAEGHDGQRKTHREEDDVRMGLGENERKNKSGRRLGKRKSGGRLRPDEPGIRSGQFTRPSYCHTRDADAEKAAEERRNKQRRHERQESA